MKRKPKNDESNQENYTEGPVCHPKKWATAVPEAEIDNNDDTEDYEEWEGEVDEWRKLIRRQGGSYWDDDNPEPDPEENIGEAAVLIFGKGVNPKYRNAHGGGPTGPTFQPNGDEGEDANADGEEQEGGDDDESASTQDDHSTPEQDESLEDDFMTASTNTETESTETEVTAMSVTQTPNSTPLSPAAAQSDYEDSVLVPASDDAPENGASEDAELSGNGWFIRRKVDTATKHNKKDDKNSNKKKNDNKEKSKKKKKEKLPSDGVADKSALEALFGPEPKDYQAKMDKAKSKNQNPPAKQPQRVRRQAQPPVDEMKIPGHTSPPPHSQTNGVNEKTPSIPNLEDLPSADASDVEALFPVLAPPVQGGSLPTDSDDVDSLQVPTVDLGINEEDEDIGVPLEVDAADLEASVDPEASESLADTTDESEEPSNDDGEITPSNTLVPSTEEENGEATINTGAPAVETPSSSLPSDITDKPAAPEPELETPTLPLLNTTTSVPTFTNTSSSSTVAPAVDEDEAEEVEGDSEGDWEDGTLFQSEPTAEETTATASSSNNSPATEPTDTPASEDIPAILPYILGPGPVIPPGVDITWPGPLGSNHAPASEVPNVPTLADGVPGVIDADSGEGGADGAGADQVDVSAGTDDVWLRRRAVNKVEIVRRAVQRRRAVVEALVRRGCGSGARDDGIVRLA